ncbi:hypothetical protein DFS34DRAFT_140403 [Phlyctochytrium arcticum]|nr:hypothetical protein DFS34DRAFT_140403 [Phlyctochytrium arcticum]
MTNSAAWTLLIPISHLLLDILQGFLWCGYLCMYCRYIFERELYAQVHEALWSVMKHHCWSDNDSSSCSDNTSSSD